MVPLAIAGGIGLTACVTDEQPGSSQLVTGFNRLANYGDQLLNTAAEVPVGVYNALTSVDLLDVGRIPPRMVGRLAVSTGNLVTNDISPYGYDVGVDSPFSDSNIWNCAMGAAAVTLVFDLSVIAPTVASGTFCGAVELWDKARYDGF